MKYFVLLTEHTLAIFNDFHKIPYNFADYIPLMRPFDEDYEVRLFLAKNLTFDDVYQFHAEYGIVPGKIYCR